MERIRSFAGISGAAAPPSHAWTDARRASASGRRYCGASPCLPYSPKRAVRALRPRCSVKRCAAPAGRHLRRDVLRRRRAGTTGAGALSKVWVCAGRRACRFRAPDAKVKATQRLTSPRSLFHFAKLNFNFDRLPFAAVITQQHEQRTQELISHQREPRAVKTPVQQVNCDCRKASANAKRGDHYD